MPIQIDPNSTTINPTTGLPYSKQEQAILNNFNTLQSAKSLLAPLDNRLGAVPASPLTMSNNDAQSYEGEKLNPQIFGDNEEARAQEQGGGEQLLNGLVKGVGLIGTTFADGVIGSIAGGLNVLATGKVDKFVDNPVTNALLDFTDKMEQKFPNYYTKEEGPFSGIIPFTKGSANFWGDKFLKNTGFAIGAYLNGMADAKLMEGLMGTRNIANKISKSIFDATNDSNKTAQILKALQEGDRQGVEYLTKGTNILESISQDAKALENRNIIQQWSGAVGGAVGESRLEALGNSRDFRKTELQKLINQYGDNIPEAELKDLDNRTENYNNAEFGINMAILTLTDYGQFSDAFKSKYAESKALLGDITGNIEEGYKAIKESNFNKTLELAKNPIYEGTQEQLQYAAQKGSDTYYGKRYDSNGKLETNNFIDSYIEGLKQAYGTGEGWEQGVIGAMTGALGMPNLRKLTNKAQAKDESWFAGGIIGELHDLQQKEKNTQEITGKLNEASKYFKDNGYLQEHFENLSRIASLNQEGKEALAKGDKFEYLNKEEDKLLSNTLAFYNAGKIEDLEGVYKGVQNKSASEVRDLFKVTTDKDGKDLETPIDPFKGFNDEELKDYFNNKANDNLEKIKTIKSLKGDIDSKFANKSDAYKEELLHYAYTIQDVDKRFDNLNSEIKLKTGGMSSQITDKQGNIREESLVSSDDPVEFEKFVKEENNYKLFKDSIDKFVKKHPEQNDLIDKGNDLIKLAQRKKQFVDKYLDDLSKTGEQVLIEKIAKQLKEAHIASIIGNTYKDKEGKEWIVRPNTTKDKYSLVQKLSDGTETSHPEMTNVTFETLLKHLKDNNYIQSGVNEEIKKEENSRQITEEQTTRLKKAIDAINNPKKLADYWRDVIKPLGLANSTGIHVYIRERYFELTGKVINDPKEDTAENVDVEKLKDIKDSINSATSLQEIADIMNNLVYPLYGKDGEYGKEFRNLGIKKWNELKALKQKQLEVLTLAVEDRYNTLNTVLDSIKSIETKVSKLTDDLNAALELNQEVQAKSNKGRNAKINQANKELAQQLLKESEIALKEAKDELAKKKDLAELIEGELLVLEKKLTQVKNDTETLKLQDKLTKEKQELADKEANQHRFDIDRLKTHLHYTQEEIKALEREIDKLNDLVFVLENSLIPRFELLADLESENKEGFFSKVRDRLSKETNPVRRIFYQQILKSPSNTFTQANVMSAYLKELKYAKQDLEEVLKKYDKTKSKEKGLLEAISNKDRITELKNDIPIFEKFLTQTKKDIKITKQEEPKILTVRNPKTTKIKLVPSPLNTKQSDDNSFVSSLSKEDYDKGEDVFTNAKRSSEMLISALTNNQENTDESGKRYYYFLDNVIIEGHQLRIVKEFRTDDKFKLLDIEGKQVHGDAGSTLLGVVVNSNNEPIDQNGNVISEKDITTKGVFSPLPLNKKGAFGDRSYGTEEEVEEAHKQLIATRKELVRQISLGETPLLKVTGKSNGIPIEIPNANVAFNEDKGLTPLTALGETGNFSNYDIKVATLKQGEKKSTIIINEMEVPVKPGYIYVVDKKTGNIYNVKSRKINSEETESIINLFKGFANSLVVTGNKIDMTNGSNQTASSIPQAPSEDFSTIFRVLEKMVFWTQNNLNDQGKAINTNPKTLFHFRENSSVPGGEVVVGVNAEGKALAYPLVSVVDGEVKFNSQLEERLKEFLPTLHLNISSALLSGQKKDDKFYELKSVKFNDQGKFEKVDFKEHKNYKNYTTEILFSPIIPRSMTGEGKANDTQFLNKYLIYISGVTNITTPKEEVKTTTGKGKSFTNLPKGFEDFGAAMDDLEEKQFGKKEETPKATSIGGREAWTKYGTELPKEVESSMSDSAKKEYGKIWSESSPIDGNDNIFDRLVKKDFEGFANIEEEKAWFKERFPNVDFHVVQNLIANKSWGQFRGAAVYIYQNAEVGTTYHEAFHVVSQLYLSKTERNTLYNEIRQRQGLSKISDKEAEEILAEEFRDFTMGKAIPKTQPKQLNWFQKLLKMITDFIFGKNIEEVFDRIQRGYYSNKEFKTAHYRGSLDRVKAIGGDNSKSETFKQDVMESLNYYFFDKLYKTQGNVNKLYKGEELDNKVIDSLYNHAKSQIKSTRDTLKKQYFLGNKFLEGTIADLDFVLEHFDNNNTDSVRQLHKEHLKKFNIEIVDTDYFNDNPQKGKDSTQLWATESLKMSSTMNANKNIKMLVASLPEIKPIKNVSIDKEPSKFRFERNSLLLPKTMDFSDTFKTLINKLSNTTSIQQQDKILKEIQQELPGIAVLRTRLLAKDFDENPTSLSFDKLLQYMQFTQSFAKQRNDFRLSLIDESGQYKVIDGNSLTISRRILDRWRSKASKDVVKRVSGQLVIDTKFSNPTTVADSLHMLKQLGIEFTRLDYSQDRNEISKQFKDLLLSYSGYENMSEAVDEFMNKTRQFFNSLNSEKDINLYDPNNEGKGYKGDLDYLVNLEEKSSIDNIENSTFTLSGERVYLNTLNNYLSNFINDINRVHSSDELFALYPHLNSVYTSNSVWLSKLFDEEGNKIKDAKINFNITLGVKEQNTSDSGDEFDNLKAPDMWMLWLNENLKGNYNFLRASDNALERFFEVGENVSQFDVNNSKYLDIILNYLKAEVDYIYSDEWKGWKNISNLDTTFEGKKKAGIILDLIKDKLPQVYKQLNNTNTYEEVLDINRGLISNTLDKYFNERTQAIKEQLVHNKIVDYNGETYKNNGISSNSKNFNEQDLVSLLKKVYINDFISNIEQTKLFIGHPLFYKDVDNFFKRMSLPVGTKKIVNVDEKTNQAINKNLKRQDGKVTLEGQQPIIKTQIFDDVVVYSDHIDNYEKYATEHYQSLGYSKTEANKIAKKLMEPYSKMEEGDGQGYITLDELREFLFRTGDWSREQEMWYQWEIQGGWDKKQVYMPDEGFYDDLKGSKITKSDFGTIVGNPQKPQHFGPLSEEGFIPAFYKLSVVPLIPSLTHGKKIDGLRQHMMKNQIGIASFVSTTKGTGSKLQEDGSLNKLYNNQGQLNLEDPNLTTQDTYYKYWGIQLDVAPKSKHEVVKGTQMAKQVINALYSNGVAKAIRFVKDGIVQEASKEATEQRVNEYINLTAKRIEIGTKELINKLGLKKDNGEFQIDNLDNLINKLVDEAISREMPENIIDSIRLIGEELGVDGTANAEKIENVLMSMADSMTISKKVHGAPKIQVASTMFENDSYGREFTIQKKGSKEKQVVSDISGLDKNDYHIVVTSNKLRSYTNNDGIVTSMEVYLPHYFEGVTDNLSIDSQNVDPRLLENIIGFRIPTQGPNALESIRIKGYLPKSAGDAIIMPSEIVAKAGSDFDIDKLNVFFPNYYKEYQDGVLKIKYTEYTDDKDVLWKRNKRRLAYANPELAEELHNINLKHKEELAKLKKGLAISEGIFESKGDIYSEFVERQKRYKDLIKQEADSNYLLGLLSEYNREPNDSTKKEIENELGVSVSQMDLGELERQKFHEYKIINTERKELWKESQNEIRNNSEIRRKYQKAVDSVENYRKAYKERAIQLKLTKEIEQEEVYNKAKPDFNKLSIEEKNGVKAIDNRLIELYKDFILSPDNFFQLVNPNTADKFKEASRYVTYLEDGKQDESFDQYKERVKKDRDNLGLYNLVDRKFIMSVTNRNLVGKALVGIGALQSTNDVIAQLYNLTIAPKIKVQDEVIETKINIEGASNTKDGSVSLSNLHNIDNEDIHDLLSQFLSAAVDAAKDPFIIDAGVTTNTANTFLYLLRAGVPLKGAVALMVQPIIKQYIENQSIYESHLSEVNGYSKYKNQILAETKRQFNNAGSTNKVFSIKELEDMIKDKSKIPDYYSKQIQVLNDFIRYQETAKKLSEAINATNYDTKSPKNSGELIFRLQQTDLVKKNGEIQNFWKLFDDNGFFKGMYDANKEFESMFKPLITTLKDSRVRALFDDFLQIFLHNAIPQEDRNSAIAKFKANFLTYVLNTEKIKINEKIYGPISNEMERLFKGKNSLPRRIEKLQAQDLSNLLINELLPIFGADIDNLKFENTRFDKLSSDSITIEWEKLFDTNPELAIDLMKFIMIQSGLENSPINFINFLPAEKYGEAIKYALNKKFIKNGDFNDFYVEFFQQAGNNDKLVPKYRKDGIDENFPLMKIKQKNPAFNPNKPEKGVSFYLPTPILVPNPNFKYKDKYQFPVNEKGEVPVRGKSDFRNNSTIKEYGNTPSIINKNEATINEAQVNVESESTASLGFDDTQSLWDDYKERILAKNPKATKEEMDKVVEKNGFEWLVEYLKKCY